MLFPCDHVQIYSTATVRCFLCSTAGSLSVECFYVNTTVWPEALDPEPRPGPDPTFSTCLLKPCQHVFAAANHRRWPWEKEAQPEMLLEVWEEAGLPPRNNGKHETLSQSAICFQVGCTASPLVNISLRSGTDPSHFCSL